MLDGPDIASMEASLAERGIPVSLLCRRAGIAETTWGRWKRREFHPSFRAWRDVSSAFHDLIRDDSDPTPACADEGRVT